MRSFLKISCIIAAFLIVLTACQTAEPEIIPEYNMSGEAVDLNLAGASIRWGFAKSGADNEENIFGFIPGTAFADTATQRKKDIENKYNCKIEMTYGNFDRIGATVQTAAVSGSSLYDIATSESFQFVQYIRAGYFTRLSNLLDVTNTDKWGTPNMLQSLMWKDDIYGVLPYAWPELLYTSFGYPIMVNENLIAQYAHSDPREYVENATWDWDRFEECLQEYTHVEGDRTIYGMATHDAYFAMMMFLSNGVTLSEYVDGEVVCGAYTNAGFEAMTRAKQIYRETCKDCFHPDDNTSNVVTNFKMENAMMLTTSANQILGTSTSVMYVMDNVGVLPYPLGPNATPGVYKGYHESILFSTSIPITSSDAEVAAFILSEMYAPFEGYETKDDIIEYMVDQIFFDERDARIYANMLENTEYGFFLEGARSIIQESVETTTSIAQLQESHEKQYDDIVEKYIQHHYSARIAVFGE